MLTTDQQLTLTYKQMFGLNNIDNTSGNTTFQGDIYVTNRFDVFGNSLILNDTSCNSFLYVNGNSNIFNNDTTVNSIINISGATTLNGNVSIGSNLSISGNSTIYGLTSVSNKTMFYNTFSIGSNLYVGGAIRFGSNFNCNTIRSIDNIPENTDLNIIADKIHIGTTNSNIYIQGTTVNLITNNLDIEDNLLTLNIDPNTANAFDNGSLSGIQIQSDNNNIGYIRVTEDGLRYQIKAPQDSLSWYIATTDSENNLDVSGPSILNNSVTISSLMYVSGNTVLQGNTTLNSSLNVSGSSLIQGTTTITGNLYISGGSLLQGYTTINSTLNVDNNLIINGASTINSLLYISGYTNINGQLTISSVLNVNGNTLILGGITINSQLSVANNTIIEGNSTILASLNISGNANLHNTNIYGSILVSGNTILNSSTTVNSQLVVNGTSYLNNNITIGSNLNIIGNIISDIPEYPDNLTAKNAGIAIWEFYRTGGIVKIRLNDQAPIITLLGNSTISIIQGDTFTDPGIVAIDYLNNHVLAYITNIGNNTTNILISGTSTLITQTSSLPIGVYTITYTATDSDGNIGYNTRNINITNPMFIRQYINNGILYRYGATVNNGWLNMNVSTNTNYTNMKNQNNWTVECWIYPTGGLSNGSESYIFDPRNINDTFGGMFSIVGISNTHARIGIWSGGPGGTGTNNATIGSVYLNTWSHLVWQKNNSNTALDVFLNGVYCNTIPISYNFSTNQDWSGCTIGKPFNYTNYYFIGIISQVHVCKGNIYSTLGFTPPLIITSNSNSVFLQQLNNTSNGFIDEISNTPMIFNGNISSSLLTINL